MKEGTMQIIKTTFASSLELRFRAASTGIKMALLRFLERTQIDMIYQETLDTTGDECWSHALLRYIP